MKLLSVFFEMEYKKNTIIGFVEVYYAYIENGT